jgi:hypothetical protein
MARRKSGWPGIIVMTIQENTANDLAESTRRQSLLASSYACEYEVAAFIDGAADIGDAA